MPDTNRSPTVEEFHLTLRSTPSAVPAEIRMRRVLKALLRSYQFRLVDYVCRDVPARPSGEKQAPAHDAGAR